MPATIPRSHAMPSVPPAPSTSTSGTDDSGGAMVGTLPAAPGDRHTYAIAYARPMAVPAATPPVEPAVPALGPRIRALRDAMDLSLRELAARSGVSAPMLSQVERGETSPTLQVAARIASGLDLRLSQLLRLEEAGAVSIVRRRERRRRRRDGHPYDTLPPPLPGQRAEVTEHTLAPGARTGAAGD